ncbi:MAG TPA: RES domain-containing protein [Candidatus Solibacter sp.]|nr:RES domain-containing protein [Candidatus Solibacter sp.]
MASRRSGPLRAFRIADMRHPIFDGSGAMLHGARWNSPGRRIIYAAETYAGALLEILVHASGNVPRTQGYIEIEIPAGLSIEEITRDDVPRWDSPSFEKARAFGDRWYDERSSPVLIVPSVVTLVERNVLINQEHPDFLRIQVSQPKPVRWDSRLWRSRR